MLIIGVRRRRSEVGCVNVLYGGIHMAYATCGLGVSEKLAAVTYRPALTRCQGRHPGVIDPFGTRDQVVRRRPTRTFRAKHLVATRQYFGPAPTCFPRRRIRLI
jgi:hypothetical protein